MWSRVERVHIIRGFSQTIFVLDFWRTYVPSAPQRLQTKASLMKVINDIEDMRNLDHNMLVFGSWIAFTSTSTWTHFYGSSNCFYGSQCLCISAGLLSALRLKIVNTNVSPCKYFVTRNGNKQHEKCLVKFPKIKCLINHVILKESHVILVILQLNWII